jgi:undecaprenyl-diphosphatase
LRHRIARGSAFVGASVALGFAATAGILDNADRWLFRAMALTASSPGWAIDATHFISLFGNVGPRAGFAIIVFALFVARHCWRSALVYVATVMLSIAGHSLAKIAYGRARPDLVPWLDQASGLSYPSGHAAGSMVVLLTAALLLRDHWLRWPAVGLALAIGVTRPMLGVHWPSDVVGGWLWGAGFALLGTAIAVALRLPRPRLIEG